MNLLQLKDVSYKYEVSTTNVLNHLNYTFEEGRVYGIMGPSGSGKTTLLSLLAGLDIAGEGSVYIDGDDLSKMDRDRYRAQTIGVVFQGYNLLNNASALENIILSMNISDSKVKDKKSHALNLLKKVGIDEVKAQRKILKLSGGEQQRVGIARALSHDPSIILADEPTGNLDEKTEKEILDLLISLAHDEGKCVIIVSHSKSVRKRMDEVIDLDKGSIKNRK